MCFMAYLLSCHRFTSSTFLSVDPLFENCRGSLLGVSGESAFNLEPT